MSTKPRVRVSTRGEILGPGRMLASLESSAPYDAGDVMDSTLSAWRPGREQPDSEAGWARSTVTARARDLARNNGFAAGAVRREAEAVVGSALRPSARPDWRALGIDRDEAVAIGQAMDAAWREWADDPRALCDATRTHSFGGLMMLAATGAMVDGEALAVLHYEETPGWRWRTRVRIVDPDLLEQPFGAADSEDMRGGIELDPHGAAVAYHFRRQHPVAAWAGRAYGYDRIERETPWGRPIVVHVWDKQRDGMTRGVSRLASSIEALKMADKYSRVELQAAVLGAILGLYVTSPLGPEVIRDLIDDGKYTSLDDARRAMHDEIGLTFGGVRLPVLAPGESIESVSVQRPAGQFDAFEAAILRQIAAGLGTSYEQLSMDFSKTNYSSMRAALMEVWRGWHARRASFVRRFADPIRLAVMEEAIDAGRVVLPAGAPSFLEAPGAWLKAKWIGPGRGFIDPVKEVQASALKVALGLSTMEDEAAELSGADYSDNLAQIEREIAEMPAGVMHPAQEKFATLIGPGAEQAGEGQEGRT